MQGHVEPGFERVREAFTRGFEREGEVGAALVVRHRGRVVVDLWGGLADPETGRPWERDTPVIVWSVTKGLVALALLMLHERGLLDYDAPLAAVWPELARDGKERVTARMLLNHRAGLSALDAPLTLMDFAGPSDRVHEAMVAQVPLWEPDTDQGYAATTYGPYTGELFRRLAGRTVGAFFRDEVAAPLGLDTWIGLPRELYPRAARLLPVPRGRVVRRQVPELLTRRTSEGRMFRRVIAGKWAYAGRAFRNPDMGPRRFDAVNDPDVLAMELPWMGAVTTADSLSKTYAAMLGEVDGVRLVRPESLRPLRHRQSWSERDRVLQKPIGWSQGFVKDELHLFSPNPASFGHPGAGGSLGWADSDAELAIGYVMNQMDWRIRSPRAVAVCHAVYASL